MCSQVLKYAKRGDFEKCCEFHKRSAAMEQSSKFPKPLREQWKHPPADSQYDSLVLAAAFLSAQSTGAEEQRVCTEGRSLASAFEASLA